MKSLPWDQRIARVAVKPLVRTAVTPNHVTLVTLLLALAGAGLLAIGEQTLANWGRACSCWRVSWITSTANWSAKKAWPRGSGTTSITSPAR